MIHIMLTLILIIYVFSSSPCYCSFVCYCVFVLPKGVSNDGDIKLVLAKLTAMETDMKDIKNTQSSIENKQSTIEKFQVETAYDIKSIRAAQNRTAEELRITIKKYSPVWNKAGKTFELAVQERLMSTMGSSYTRGLNIRNLAYGVGRGNVTSSNIAI